MYLNYAITQYVKQIIVQYKGTSFLHVIPNLLTEEMW